MKYGLNLVILLTFAAQLFAEADSVRTEAEVSQLRKQFKSKSMAEKIVDFPSEIVFFPLKTAFKLTEAGIRWSDEHNLSKKVVDLLTSDDGRRGLRPVYSSRKGLGVSLYQRALVNANSKLSFTTAVAQKWLQYYEIRFKRLRFFSDKTLLNISAYYHKLPDEDYYGYGPTSLKETELDYVFEQSKFQFGLDYAVGRQNYFGISGGISIDNVFPEKLSETNPDAVNIYQKLRQIEGFKTDLKFAFVESQLTVDTKNRTANASSGMDLTITGKYYWQINDDEFAFWKLSADWTKYFHLFYNRVLLVRLNAGMTEQSGGRSIPFYHLSEIGTYETIRSLERGRFRDKDFLIGTLEYRYPISHNIDALIFMDSGQVTRNLFETIDWDHQVFTFGGGFRLFSAEGLKAKVEVGGGKEGFKIQLSLNTD